MSAEGANMAAELEAALGAALAGLEARYAEMTAEREAVLARYTAERTDLRASARTLSRQLGAEPPAWAVSKKRRKASSGAE